MTAHLDPAAALADPAALLDRAIGFALGAVQAVTPERLSDPTPCAKWDLRSLLLHVTDSLDVLCDGLDTGQVDLPVLVGAGAGAGGGAAGDPAAQVRDRAARLRGWASHTARSEPVRIADSALDPRIVLGVGAIEIAVHGWDIGRACGLRRPIPPALAADLAGICALVVTSATRHPAFADPVAVPDRACPSDQLIAFLGRDPNAAHDFPRRDST
jgi:uncharacterized protein (TIGR03086 family)